MVCQMELSYSTEDLHLSITRQVLRNLVQSLIEMHQILAVDVIY